MERTKMEIVFIFMGWMEYNTSNNKIIEAIVGVYNGKTNKSEF